MPRAFLLFAALALASAASAQTYTGRLAAADPTLPSGEFVDEYPVEARRGQSVRAVVTSESFDTYVIVKSASGEQAEDDDCTDGETSRSCVVLVADQDGEVRVLVTSFRPGETGAYQVAITVGDDLPPVGGRAVANTLGIGDETLQTGEFYNRHTLRLEAGERRRVVLTSTDFDPYLIATGPGDARQENDDCADGDADRSCLDLVADEAGEWDILVTTYAPGEGGEYTLDLGEPAAGPDQGVRGGVRSEH